MKAVLLSPRSGSITVEDVPSPVVEPGYVLIRNEYSLISAGTERATVSTGTQSLVGKARQRPDQVRQVLDNLRKDGLVETYRVVQDRLDRPMLLGYSSAGTVLSAGEGADVPVGTRVAAAGAGYASHCEIVSVPKNLVVPIPDGVNSQWAAFSTVGAIALQGIHQADVLPGSRVGVIGLGLVGQLTVRLLKAYGYDVVGIDLDEHALELADRAGVTALSRNTEDLTGQLKRIWGNEADAVLITAATKSADPVELAGSVARDRAVVVIVGDVLVSPPRSSYYRKELSIRYSRSYGPGRYDQYYEERGGDYPEGYVPWPERRNLSEFLRLLGTGALELASLDPHVLPVEQADQAYALLKDPGEEERRVALLLRYTPSTQDAAREPAVSTPAAVGKPWSEARGTVRVAAIGAGNFATKMLFPHVGRAPDTEFAWITTGRGVNAMHQAKCWQFRDVAESVTAGFAKGTAEAVIIASRHDSHAGYFVQALLHGLATFCEKPIGLTESDLETVAEAFFASGAPAMVGFNRRFSPAIRELKKQFPEGAAQLVYRVFAGTLASDHWYFDPRQGGRLVGEVCHFVDTATHLLGSTPVLVNCTGLDSTDPALAQSLTVDLRYANGSTATVVYAGATPGGAPKEFIEIAGQGVAARIDDFQTLDVWTTNGHRQTRYKGGPKGHAEEMAAFLGAARGRNAPEADFASALASSLATCRAADSLRTGAPIDVTATSPALARALDRG